MLPQGFDRLADRLGVGARRTLALALAEHPEAVLLLGDVGEVEVEPQCTDQFGDVRQIEVLNEGEELRQPPGVRAAQSDGRPPDDLLLLKEGPAGLGKEHLPEELAEVFGAAPEVRRHGEGGALARCLGHPISSLQAFAESVGH